MIDLAAGAAVVLVVVFGWAAAAKLRRRPATERSFRELGLPAPALLSRAVPLVEAAVATGLVVRPAPAALAALVLLVAFSAVVLRAILRGDDVACACFGATTNEAVSTADLLRNAGLAALAVLASASRAGTALPVPALVPTVAVVIATAAAAGLVAVYRRRVAVRRGPISAR